MNPHSFAQPPLHQPFYGAGPGDAISRFFKKYGTFKGRASRSEFWWIIGFLWLVRFILSVIVQIIIVSTGIYAGIAANDVSSLSGLSSFAPIIWILGVLSFVWWCVTLVPFMALSVRRAHDTNRKTIVGVLFALCYNGIATFVIICLFTIIFLFIGLASTSDISSSSDHKNALIAWLVLGIILGVVAALIFTVVMLIFMCLPSDPRGIRFDDPAYAVSYNSAPPQWQTFSSPQPQGTYSTAQTAQGEQIPVQNPYVPTQPMNQYPTQPVDFNVQNQVQNPAQEQIPYADPNPYAQPESPDDYQ